MVIRTLVSDSLYTRVDDAGFLPEIEGIAVASYPGSCGIMSSGQQVMKSRDAHLHTARSVRNLTIFPGTGIVRWGVMS
jgi:hypothetical protein